MAEQFKFEGFLLRSVQAEREINYEVTDKKGYVCRLVPVPEGFDISPLDRAIENLRALPVLQRLSDFILNRYA